MSLADLTAAPMLFKYGAATYEISPLNQKDWGCWLRFVQFYSYYEAKQLEGATAAMVNLAFAECLKNKVSLVSPQSESLSGSPAGQVELTYLSLRKKHPDIKRETIELWDLATLLEITELVLAISLNYGDSEAKQEQLKKRVARMRESGLLV